MWSSEGEAAGDVIGLVERGRAGRDQADTVRWRAASADSSVNGSNEVTVWLRFNALIGMFEHGQMVGHEEGVELAGLELADQRLDVRRS